MVRCLKYILNTQTSGQDMSIISLKSAQSLWKLVGIGDFFFYNFDYFAHKLPSQEYELTSVNQNSRAGNCYRLLSVTPPGTYKVEMGTKVDLG